MEDILNIEEEIFSIDNDDIQEFSGNLSYDNFIVLDRKELLNFIRVVDPLSSFTVDNYGKSITFRCNGVEVDGLYYNNPYNVLCKLKNSSGSTVPTFSVSINVLKKLVQNSLSSVILVFQDDNIYLSICESLLYVETLQLDALQYPEVKSSTEPFTLDVDKSIYAITSLSKCLVKTDRASEKVVFASEGSLWASTGIFAAQIKSPFSVDLKCVLYKQVIDVIESLINNTRVALKYQLLDDNTLYLNCDDVIFCNLPVGESKLVDEFLTTQSVNSLKFDAGVTIVNDSITRIVSLVNGLDYLSEVITVECKESEMVMTLYSKDMSKSSVYKYPIVSGSFKFRDPIRVNSSLFLTLLSVAGSEAKYQQTENGLGFINDNGVFLIRRLN